MIVARTYNNEHDYELMRGLLCEAYSPSAGCYCTLGDLDWWRSAEAQPATLHAQLWFDDSHLVGFCWPGDSQIDIVTHPDYHDLFDEMLAWGEDRYHIQAREPAPYIQAWAFTKDTQRIHTLQRRGYQIANDALYFYQRVIGADLPDVQLPAGYTVRQFAGISDMDQRIAVHRDAFAPSKMTSDRHTLAMSLPTYRIDLDLVVVAADQQFAAFCIVWFDAIARLGIFEPVGCHSAHRRLGLASAVMVEGLHRLRALGATVAYVNTGVDNLQANALYQSLGFVAVDRNQSWQRNLGA